MPKPIPFKRGSTFSFSMKIPDAFADGFFRSWKPTAQLRRERSNLKSGFIADISCHWADPETTRILVLVHNVTDGWPVGNAELDVLFTSSDGASMRSTTQLFAVQPEITR